ncbi:MAG: tetratricopeptide repeat protein [Elusimicrobia bacterium]|nr:tetratricopeptide repeat protein [Elusimicrobiota bacterium]
MGPVERKIDEGLELAQAGKREEALAHFAELARAFPGDARVHYELASALDSLGREEEAIPHYQKALDSGLSEEFRPEALLGLGSSLRVVGRTRDAVALLENAAKEHPQFVPLRAFRALARLAAGIDKEEAISELKGLLHGGELGAYERVVRRYFEELTSP